MKYVLFLMFVGLPVLLLSQVSDAVSVLQAVDSLVQLNRKMVSERRYTEALEVINDAKNKAQSLLGVNHAAYADCLFNYGRTYHVMDDLQGAEPLYKEAKEAIKRTLGKGHPSYAKCLNNLGLIYSKRGDIEASEAIFVEAIEVKATFLGKEHPDYANSLTAYANLLTDKGEYLKAENMHKEAIVIREIKLGKQHPHYLQSLNNLAGLYFLEGNYMKSEIMYNEMIGSWQNVPNKEDPEYANLLNNVASLYTAQAKYSDAEQLYMETAQIRERIFGKEHTDYAQSLNNLGTLYTRMGNFEKAEALYTEAANIIGRILGEESLVYGLMIHNLSNLYNEMGEYQKAEIICLQTLSITEKVLGKNHADYASYLSNLAGITLHKGDFKKAEVLYSEVLRRQEETLGKNHPDYSISLINYAYLYSMRGDFKKAETMCLEAKEIWATKIGKNNPLYVSALDNLIDLYQRADRNKEAENLFLEANTLNELIIKNMAVYSSESQMLATLQHYIDKTARLKSFSRNHQSPEILKTVFDNTLFLNGYLLENARKIMNSIDALDSLTRETHNRWQACRRRLSSEYSKPILQQKFVAELEAEAEGYEKQLMLKLPTFDKAFNAPNWKNVCDQLKYNEVAIEFIYFKYFTPNPTDSTLYAALVLLPNDTTPHFIPLFEERQLLPQLQRPGLSDEITVKDLYGNRPELAQLFWKPLEAVLKDVKTIYYAPSGLLHQINPGAILDESGVSISQKRQWVRLGSTRELVTGHLADQSFAHETPAADRPPSAVRRESSAVVFGGIAYDMDSLAYAAANPLDLATASEAPRKDGNFRYIAAEQPIGTRGESEGAWTPLPGTAREADEVGGVLRKAKFQTEVLKGPAASEERFKSMGANGALSPRILHLATHGFAYPDPKKAPPKSFGDAEPTYKLQDDPMLRSGLLLAGSNFYWKNKRPLANREDGVLVAYEVRDMNLRNTELAVLSACQTGLGDVVGSEGVYGLQRAFRIAGAKFLIVSLWQVPDAQTQELMRLFYQHWVGKKESLREAFNHAQQAMRVKDPNPFWWAGFVLVE